MHERELRATAFVVGMRNKFDYFGKLIVQAGTHPRTRVRQEQSILAEEQVVDCFISAPKLPIPDFDPQHHTSGWLGKITQNRCLVEPFHQAPSLNEVRQCIQKQRNFAAQLRREAARVGDKADEAEAENLPLWIIAGGDPETARRLLGFAPTKPAVSQLPEGRRELPWPSGFYSAAEGFALHLVVTSELPPIRSTLMLRLLSAGKTFALACKQLHELPTDAEERDALLPWIRSLRLIPEESMAESEEEREAIMDIISWSAEIDRELKLQGRLEGREEGREEGRAETLLSLAALRLNRVLTESEKQALKSRTTAETFAQVQAAIVAPDIQQLIAFITPRA